MFDVYIEDKANRDLAKLPSNYRRVIFEKINKFLSVNPFPRADNPKKLKGEYIYRLRIGDYRALYEINGNKVLVYAVKHRKDVYYHL
jgi:mRNA interferase RelE/StbE